MLRRISSTPDHILIYSGYSESGQSTSLSTKRLVSRSATCYDCQTAGISTIVEPRRFKDYSTVHDNSAGCHSAVLYLSAGQQPTYVQTIVLAISVNTFYHQRFYSSSNILLPSILLRSHHGPKLCRDLFYSPS